MKSRNRTARKKATTRLDRQAFLNRLNADFARLRADKDAWQEELAERRLWENTLMDGLDDV